LLQTEETSGKKEFGRFGGEGNGENEKKDEGKKHLKQNLDPEKGK